MDYVGEDQGKVEFLTPVQPALTGCMQVQQHVCIA
jgi:hypothetical protein